MSLLSLSPSNVKILPSPNLGEVAGCQKENKKRDVLLNYFRAYCLSLETQRIHKVLARDGDDSHVQCQAGTCRSLGSL